MKGSDMMPDEHRLDPQLVEWIQADLDGELAVEDFDQLQRALAESEEARAYQQQMRRVCELLDEVPALDPPLGLTRAILDHLPVPVQAATRLLWAGRGGWNGADGRAGAAGATG